MTGDTENHMHDINSEICFVDELSGSEIKQDAIQRREKDARHKLMTNYQIASRVKVENPPEWSAIYGIRVVKDSDAMDI